MKEINVDIVDEQSGYVTAEIASYKCAAGEKSIHAEFTADPLSIRYVVRRSDGDAIGHTDDKEKAIAYYNKPLRKRITSSFEL